MKMLSKEQYSCFHLPTFVMQLPIVFSDGSADDAEAVVRMAAIFFRDFVKDASFMRGGGA